SLSISLYMLRPPHSSTLFPYTTLFRSNHHINLMGGHEVRYEESQGLKHEYFEFPASNFGLKDVSLAGRTERGESEADRYGLVSGDRKSTRLNSSHVKISYAVFCLKKKR